MEIEEQFRRDVRKLLEDHALSAEDFVRVMIDLMMNLLRVRAWRNVPKEDLKEHSEQRDDY